MGFLKNKRQKKSADGSTVDILTYEDNKEKTFESPQSVCVYLEEIEDYVNEIYNASEEEGAVFHEILSDLVHIDVHIIWPNDKRPYHIIYTTGMSDLPMTVPDGLDNPAAHERAEIVMYLPPDWDLGMLGKTDRDVSDEYYWPLYWIKYLARFPHEYHTWFGVGHTIPNGPDYESVGMGTTMGGFLFLAPFHLKPLVCKDGAQINFLWAVPMYREEIEYKLEHGLGAILDLMDQNKTPLEINPVRACLV